MDANKIALMVEHARKGRLSEATVHALKKCERIIVSPTKKNQDWIEAFAEGKRLHPEGSECDCRF